MRVELLYFDECPNYEVLLPHLRDLLSAAGVDEDIELRRIASEDDAQRLRFLGSPTLRVDGHDVDPGSGQRDDFGLKCRLYATPEGIEGVPPDDWVVSALRRAADRGARGGAGFNGSNWWAARSVATRLEGLERREPDLFRGVLRSFLAGWTPTAAELERRAVELGLRLDAALAEFERRDLLWLDPGRTRVAVAYPFSGEPTPHRVEFARSGTEAFAMCAIDALGIPFLAWQPATVRSHDPITNEPVEVNLDPAGERRWSPRAAVVVAACSGEGPSLSCVCPHVHFVGSPERATHLGDAAGDASVEVFGMAEAIELGRLIFGGLLDAK
jgi:hypothetical protein